MPSRVVTRLDVGKSAWHRTLDATGVDLDDLSLVGAYSPLSIAKLNKLET